MKTSGARIAITYMTTAVAMIFLAGPQHKAFGQTAAATDTSCKAYVQKFFDYYRKEVKKDSKLSPDMRAINSKEFVFSEEIKKGVARRRCCRGEVTR